MKIGLIRETKIPEDNRVALTPHQVKELQDTYKDIQFCVQNSPSRSYSDEEYQDLGIEVKDNMSDCDVLLGIKEADISTLIPEKHYFFFGHIAKMQSYNRPLLQKMMEMKLTFSDYEYLVDDNGVRLCAFGWWAGVVGVYNTLRAYGQKYSLFTLEKPDRKFTLNCLINRLKEIELPAIKIVLTGNGRVSHGAQFVLNKMGIKELSVENYLNTDIKGPCFCVADIDQLVRKRNRDENTFDLLYFRKHPQEYVSNFERFYRVSDILISCHFWAPGQAVYMSEDNLKNQCNKIRVIGDITCDIQGSIKSTIRPSTHDDPFYDYNPQTMKEEKAFSDSNNITVMAVDTLPNALARDTSEYFGELLVQHVIIPLCTSQKLDVIEKATILKNGKLTETFNYLKDFANADIK